MLFSIVLTRPGINAVRDPAQLDWQPIVKIEHYRACSRRILGYLPALNDFRACSKLADGMQTLVVASCRCMFAGVRCHTNTLIEVQSPITAFCGLNGTGKSTLLQLAAVAYRGAVGVAGGRYHIASFIL